MRTGVGTTVGVAIGVGDVVGVGIGVWVVIAPANDLADAPPTILSEIKAERTAIKETILSRLFFIR